MNKTSLAAERMNQFVDKVEDLKIKGANAFDNAAVKFADAMGSGDNLAFAGAGGSFGKNWNHADDFVGRTVARVEGAVDGQLDEVVEESKRMKILEVENSADTNRWWKEEMDYDNPPYKENTKVQILELIKDSKFVRVYDGKTSGMYGGWLMKESDIISLTAEEIKDKFALPSKPKYVCDVLLKEGDIIRSGIAGPLDKWGKGGGIQYDLMGQRIGEFNNQRLLKDVK